MRLEILLPERVLLDVPVAKVVAEAVDGAFCLLPRHVDFVTALVPGVLEYVTAAGDARLVAVDEGVLVKCAGEVRVSTRRALAGTDLAVLRDTVQTEFKRHDEHERLARSALARLEASVVRSFVALR